MYYVEVSMGCCILGISPVHHRFLVFDAFQTGAGALGEH